YNGVPVTRIGIEAFRGCKVFSKVTLPNSIRVIDSYAFYDVGPSGSVVFEIAEGVQTIGQFAFAKNSMTNFTLPNSVTRIHKGILFDCYITKLTLPFIGETLDGATNNHFGWVFNATNYMDNVNKVSTYLYEVTITGGTIIPRGAFHSCKFIQSITLPSTLKTIDTVAFYGCEKLVHITIPSGVTTIGSQSFQNCQTLETILLPTSVTTVADYAFNGCPNINRIYYAGSQEDWNKMSIGDNNGYFSSENVLYNCTQII
ncbi:MAG: leucine-rich repeat protein, partial [Clostridia bacterium]|nr:leucine-rich repeat protein [Clostridia bacterium]